MKKFYIIIMTYLLVLAAHANGLPNNFVYLQEVAPTILQDIRYAGSHNFIGHSIKGYNAAKCILTKQAAAALVEVQAELSKASFSLKVYDCYRPQMAVDEFKEWSTNSQHFMQQEFYPNVAKNLLFKEGYISSKSGHSRGSTVDLTIVAIPALKQATYQPGDKLISCTADYSKRFRDNSIDMGTGYDCLDPLSHPNNKTVKKTAYQNRQLLQTIMQKYGFKGITTEWWHFTLQNEPYPDTYFNFPIN